MRFVGLLVLLGLVGVAAWLLMEKVGERRPSSASERTSEEAPVTITDEPSSAETVSRSETPLPSTAPKPTSPRSGKKSLSLAYFYAQAPSCELIQHTYYALCYDENAEQPRWTVHMLEGKKLKASTIRRTQDFRPDPKVSTLSAQLEDYRKSGYDRGHLVPAGDFKWDSVGMSETFYLSNMSPQLHEFNAGIWEDVERTVRTWAKQKGRLLVYTGPILDKPKEYIGPNRVAVPRAFYKVVYELIGDSAASAVAFLVPHAPSRRSPGDFVVTVDSVEKLVGIDFFPALPDPWEEKIEGRIEKRAWPVPSPSRR